MLSQSCDDSLNRVSDYPSTTSCPADQLIVFRLLWSECQYILFISEVETLLIINQLMCTPANVTGRDNHMVRLKMAVNVLFKKSINTSL